MPGSMMTFLLVDSNQTDLFIHERVLELAGFNKIKTFKTISEAWISLSKDQSRKAIIFVDIQAILREDWLTLSSPKEFRGELEIYVVDVIIDQVIKEDLRNFKTIKGFIEKPLTLQKAIKILGLTDRDSLLSEPSLSQPIHDKGTSIHLIKHNLTVGN